MQKYISLRILGYRSLGMTVPIEFARSRGLGPGDHVLWEEEGDSVRLRFFKVTKVRTPAPIEQEAPEAAE
jgi:hypothetical protein